MNERIKQLELQAADGTVDPNGPFTAEEFNNFTKKFAELIVAECGVALSPMLRDMISRGQAYDLIKQHFGVEE